MAAFMLILINLDNYLAIGTIDKVWTLLATDTTIKGLIIRLNLKLSFDRFLGASLLLVPKTPKPLSLICG